MEQERDCRKRETKMLATLYDRHAITAGPPELAKQHQTNGNSSAAAGMVPCHHAHPSPPVLTAGAATSAAPPTASQLTVLAWSPGLAILLGVCSAGRTVAGPELLQRSAVGTRDEDEVRGTCNVDNYRLWRRCASVG